MTTAYEIVPIPRWYFAENTGIPLGGGYMSTWRSLDHTAPKPIYTDSSGNTAWPNPVSFDLNGEAPGPFFWADDEPYFIEVFDADDTLLFSMDNYGPGISGGGTVIPNNFLENYVVNNVFWRNQGTLNNIQNGTVIAPGNHDGFQYSDIQYIRSNNSSTDNLAFATSDFNAGVVPLTNDVTPEFYIDLSCSAAGSETLKCVQFPIDLHVKNLEQQTMTAIVWAKGVSDTQSLTMNFLQSFGTGSSEPNVSTSIDISANPLADTWQAYIGTFTVPSVGGKSLGAGGDDATYLQVCFPVSATFRIFVTKPKLYLGTISSVFPELQTYDYIDRIINTPRTGDYRFSLNSFSPFGWVPANDQTIGSAASSATTRANQDTWPLYNLLWSSVLNNWAPVSTGRGSSAIADFAANKTITLTRNLGRVIAGANGGLNAVSSFTATAATDIIAVSSTTNFPTGTPVQLTTLAGCTPLVINTVYYAINISSTTLKLATTLDLAYASTPINITVDGTGVIQNVLGSYVGESAHTMTGAELVSHSHLIEGVIENYCAGGGSSTYNTTGGSTTSTSLTGSTTPFNVLQPTAFTNVFIKL